MAGCTGVCNPRRCSSPHLQPRNYNPLYKNLQPLIPPRSISFYGLESGVREAARTFNGATYKHKTKPHTPGNLLNWNFTLHTHPPYIYLLVCFVPFYLYIFLCMCFSVRSALYLSLSTVTFIRNAISLLFVFWWIMFLCSGCEKEHLLYNIFLFCRRLYGSINWYFMYDWLNWSDILTTLTS